LFGGFGAVDKMVGEAQISGGARQKWDSETESHLHELGLGRRRLRRSCH